MNCEIATTLIIQTAGRISERLSFPLGSPADGRRRVGSCTGCFLLFFLLFLTATPPLVYFSGTSRLGQARVTPLLITEVGLEPWEK